MGATAARPTSQACKRARRTAHTELQSQQSPCTPPRMRPARHSSGRLVFCALRPALRHALTQRGAPKQADEEVGHALAQPRLLKALRRRRPVVGAVGSGRWQALPRPRWRAASAPHPVAPSLPAPHTRTRAKKKAATMSQIACNVGERPQSAAVCQAVRGGCGGGPARRPARLPAAKHALNLAPCTHHPPPPARSGRSPRHGSQQRRPGRSACGWPPPRSRPAAPTRPPAAAPAPGLHAGRGGAVSNDGGVRRSVGQPASLQAGATHARGGSVTPPRLQGAPLHRTCNGGREDAQQVPALRRHRRGAVHQEAQRQADRQAGRQRQQLGALRGGGRGAKQGSAGRT